MNEIYLTMTDTDEYEGLTSSFIAEENDDEEADDEEVSLHLQSAEELRRLCSFPSLQIALNLTSLSLSRSTITDSDLHVLGTAIENYCFFGLKTLDLSANVQFTHVGISALVRTLTSKCCPHLSELIFDNTQVTTEMMTCILNICSRIPCRYLSFDNSFQEGDSFVQTLMSLAFVDKVFPLLEELFLNDNDLTGLFIQTFSWSMANNTLPQLQVFEFENCSLHGSDIQTLATALGHDDCNVSSLTRINLSKNEIGDDGMLCLLSVILHNKERFSKLETLILDNTFITDASGVKLLELLRWRQSWEELDLSGNAFSPEFHQTITEGISEGTIRCNFINYLP